MVLVDVSSVVVMFVALVAVVAVAALPPMLNDPAVPVKDVPAPLNVPAVAVPVTDRDPRVPTDVSEDAVTVELSVVPVKVPAAAVIVCDPPSEIDVPLTVIELFVSAPFGMLLSDATLPLNVLQVIVPLAVSDPLDGLIVTWLL